MQLSVFLSTTKYFSEDAVKHLDAAFSHIEIPKGEIVNIGSRHSPKLYFIQEGLLRTYYLQDGKDITHFFFDRDSFLAPINSIYYNESERYEFEALEDCSIRVIDYQAFLILEEKYPKLTRIMLDFALQMLDIFSQKLNLLQFQTAYDRYQLFLKMYPRLLNRVSLGSTASFLGVTQQTLSVIRARKK